MLLSEHNAVMMRWRPIIRLAGIPSARGYCGLAGHALHVRCAVMDRALRGANSRADISTLFGQRRRDATSESGCRS